ncbi:hypothetical protein [Haloarcula salina]|uniref:Uncharacterized protein n=1 Tax=Haloarcula salina TaxID=1429914 RepID=A0AA41G0M2_9EURY|nr:hypothetical protein [Haloarcula salina]MBV0902222.1 hypothetical protein [Haloarcula salina]
MNVTNRRGTPVDPVPFLVVALSGILLSYVFLPSYLLYLGAPLTAALAATTLVAAASVAASFYRYCWTVRPALRGEVPASLRFQRLVYGTAVIGGLLVLLALPLLL